MELFDVLLAVFGAIAPTATGFVFWLLSVRRDITRLKDRVLERGDGQPAPLLRSYATREWVAGAMREREKEWEGSSAGRFRLVMDKLEELTKTVASLQKDIGKLEGIIETRDRPAR